MDTEQSQQSSGPIRPTIMTTFTINSENTTEHTFGPFTRRDTAAAVGRNKGPRGTVAAPIQQEYVVWRDERGELWGRQVVGGAVRLIESAAEDAQLESILGRLLPSERAFLEARLVGS